MKKTVISLIAATACFFAAHAQSATDNPDNRPYFGLRVAADMICPGQMKSGNIGVDAFDDGSGVEFGAIYNIPVVANFYIEPGLKFYYSYYEMYSDMIEGISNDVDVSIRKFGMRVPVMAGYHFDFTPNTRLHVFTGPELEIGFSAKTHVSSRGVSVSESIYGTDGGMRRVDVLWGIGVGLAYKHFYVSVGGSLGICNMLSDADGVSFRENRASIGIGYNF